MFTFLNNIINLLRFIISCLTVSGDIVEHLLRSTYTKIIYKIL